MFKDKKTVKLACSVATSVFIGLVCQSILGCKGQDESSSESSQDVRKTPDENSKQSWRNEIKDLAREDVSSAIKRTETRLGKGLYSIQDLEAKIDHLFRNQILNTPLDFLKHVDDLENKDFRGNMYNVVLSILIKNDSDKAIHVVSSLPSGKLPGMTVQRLTHELALNSPEKLKHLLKQEGKRNPFQIASGLNTFYHAQDLESGIFPETALLLDSVQGREALQYYLNGQGKPRNVKQLESWLHGAAGEKMSSIRQEACEQFGAVSPQAAELYIQGKGNKLSYTLRHGLIKGISESDSKRASELALKDQDGAKMVASVIGKWLEDDSQAASDWLTEIENPDIRSAAIGKMVKWLDYKGIKDQAAEWREELARMKKHR